MYLNSNNIEKYLKRLDKNSLPKWGTLNPSQMLFHCNTFIEVSLGRKKLNFITNQYKISGSPLPTDQSTFREHAPKRRWKKYKAGGY